MIRKVAGVRFEWSVLEEVGDCMNRAVLSIEDACHRVEGVLRICSHETDGRTRSEWRPWIDAVAVPGGEDDRPFGTDVRSFVQIAEQRTAASMTEALRKKQENTRQLLAKQDRRRSRAEEVRNVLENLQTIPP